MRLIGASWDTFNPTPTPDVEKAALAQDRSAWHEAAHPLDDGRIAFRTSVLVDGLAYDAVMLMASNGDARLVAYHIAD